MLADKNLAIFVFLGMLAVYFWKNDLNLSLDFWNPKI